MVGLAYASVPLYDLFCKVTGFDGTPIVQRRCRPREVRPDDRGAFRRQRGARASTGASRPRCPKSRSRLGETTTVLYKVTNDGAGADDRHRHLQRAAGPRRQPISSKLECFCFTEQTLAARRDRSNRRSSSTSTRGIVEDPDVRDSVPSPFPTPISPPRGASRWRRPLRHRQPKPNVRITARDKPDGNVLKRSASYQETLRRRDDEWPRPTPRTTTTTSSIRARGRSSVRSAPS